MIVYVHTWEPFHENSEQLGAYLDRDAAVRAAIAVASEDPETPLDSDWELRGWDTDTGKLVEVILVYRHPSPLPSWRHGYESVDLPGAVGQGLWIKKSERLSCSASKN